MLYTWCHSVVNRASLSLLATCRMRSNACCRGTRFCARSLVCCTAFPLVGPLPSTVSAAPGEPGALFDGFLGTMGPSDFPPPFIDRLPLLGSGRGPETILQASGGISRFPCKELPGMHGVYDRAGSNCTSP